MHFRGATSLADVPFWRKPTERLTAQILPRKRLFLKANITTSFKLCHLISAGYSPHQ
jgi:hypothetical protein